jgi:hypothetical protein
VNSAAFDAVASACHLSPEDGGPCATCAFRDGTEANTTAHTVTLATFCVEGLRPFYCHEQPRLCRGYIAAVNLLGTPKTKADKRHAAAAAFVADMLGFCIGNAAAADAPEGVRR